MLPVGRDGGAVHHRVRAGRQVERADGEHARAGGRVGWATSEQARAGARPRTAPSASRVICSGRNCSPLIRASASRCASVGPASQPVGSPPGARQVGGPVQRRRRGRHHADDAALRRAPTRVPSTSCWDTSRGDPGSLTSTTVVVVVGEPVGPGQIDRSSVAPDRPWPGCPCPSPRATTTTAARPGRRRGGARPPGLRRARRAAARRPPQPPSAAASAGTTSEPIRAGRRRRRRATTSRSPTVVHRRPSDVFITSGSSTPASCRLVPVAPLPTAPSGDCGPASSDAGALGHRREERRVRVPRPVQP